MKNYADFKRTFLDRPPMPANVTPELQQLFRPITEPNFDEHNDELLIFDVWLANPVSTLYPQGAADKNDPIGAWVFSLTKYWISRYDEHRMKASRRTNLVARFLGTGFFGALAAGGLDGELDGVEELIAPIGAGAARIFVPNLTEAYRDKAIRNKTTLDQVASHY